MNFDLHFNHFDIVMIFTLEKYEDKKVDLFGIILCIPKFKKSHLQSKRLVAVHKIVSFL